MGKKTKIAGGLALIIITAVFALGIASLATPWWINQSSNRDGCSFSNSWEWKSVIGVQSSCSNCVGELLACGSASISNGQSWRSNNCKLDPNSSTCRKLPMIWDATEALMIIGTVLAGILVLLTIIGLVASKVLPKFLTLKILAIGGFFVMVFLLIPVILIAAGMPPVYQESTDCGNAPGCTFIGVNDIDGYWGPAIGWILAVIAAGLALIYSCLMCIA